MGHHLLECHTNTRKRKMRQAWACKGNTCHPKSIWILTRIVNILLGQNASFRLFSYGFFYVLIAFFSRFDRIIVPAFAFFCMAFFMPFIAFFRGSIVSLCQLLPFFVWPFCMPFIPFFAVWSQNCASFRLFLYGLFLCLFHCFSFAVWSHHHKSSSQYELIQAGF